MAWDYSSGPARLPRVFWGGKRAMDAVPSSEWESVSVGSGAGSGTEQPPEEPRLDPLLPFSSCADMARTAQDVLTVEDRRYHLKT